MYKALKEYYQMELKKMTHDNPLDREPEERLHHIPEPDILRCDEDVEVNSEE